MTEKAVDGEPLVKSLRALPHDASLVLVRLEVIDAARPVPQETPVDDLIIEDTDPFLRESLPYIVNPVALLLPRPLLQALSWLDR